MTHVSRFPGNRPGEADESAPRQTVYGVGKSMDDGVQRGKVQGTTCRKNKQNEGVHNGRKDSGKSTVLRRKTWV